MKTKISADTFRMYSVLLILIVGIVGGCASDSKPQHRAEERDQRAILNEGYSLIYNDISSLSRIGLIFFVKTESSEVNEVTKKVTDYAKKFKKKLEYAAENYPAVNLKLDSLPVMEERTRKAMIKDRLRSVAPVVGLKGESFNRRMLQTLEGSLNHNRFLCKVLAEEEPEPGLKQILTNAETEFERLYARVLGLLLEKYYINTGESKVKK
jgi:hypothetical protein